MKSFTKTGRALIDSDDGNCLLAKVITGPEASNLSIRLFDVPVSLLALSLPLRHHSLRSDWRRSQKICRCFGTLVFVTLVLRLFVVPRTLAPL
jgi:hypothetical protein